MAGCSEHQPSDQTGDVSGELPMTTMYESLDTSRPVVYESILCTPGNDSENPVPVNPLPVNATYESLGTSRPGVVYDRILQSPSTDQS